MTAVATASDDFQASLKLVVKSAPLVGKGRRGHVYEVNGLAYKLGKIGKYERQVQFEAAKLSLAPKVFVERDSFLSMQLVRGAKPAKTGSLRSYEYVWLCYALAKLALAGYRHCDLAQQNILRLPNQLPMLIDFGCAKPLASTDSWLTELHRVASWHSEYCRTQHAAKLGRALLLSKTPADAGYQLALAVMTLPKSQRYLFAGLTFC